MTIKIKVNLFRDYWVCRRNVEEHHDVCQPKGGSVVMTCLWFHREGLFLCLWHSWSILEWMWTSRSSQDTRAPQQSTEPLSAPCLLPDPRHYLKRQWVSLSVGLSLCPPPPINSIQSKGAYWHGKHTFTLPKQLWTKNKNLVLSLGYMAERRSWCSGSICLATPGSCLTSSWIHPSIYVHIIRIIFSHMDSVCPSWKRKPSSVALREDFPCQKGFLGVFSSSLFSTTWLVLCWF